MPNSGIKELDCKAFIKPNVPRDSVDVERHFLFLPAWYGMQSGMNDANSSTTSVSLVYDEFDSVLYHVKNMWRYFGV